MKISDSSFISVVCINSSLEKASNISHPGILMRIAQRLLRKKKNMSRLIIQSREIITL